MKMRTVSLKRVSLLLLVAATLIAPASVLAQKTKTRVGQEKTVIGYISESSCGLQHMAGMDEKDCTLMCAKNGKFVLADRNRKIVYQLDKTGQEKAREFAGLKVKVKGRVTGKTIRVTAIEATS